MLSASVATIRTLPASESTTSSWTRSETVYSSVLLAVQQRVDADHGAGDGRHARECSAPAIAATLVFLLMGLLLFGGVQSR